MPISRSEGVELDCPFCGQSFETTVWRIVDAGERPDLRQLILLGRLNVARCPYCTTEGPIPTALLYHDAAHQAVLLALPSGEPLDEAQVRLQADPLVAILHRTVPPEAQRPYLFNVQLAGTMAGLAAEIRSWGQIPLGPGG
jgi:hypothetical protein